MAEKKPRLRWIIKQKEKITETIKAKFSMKEFRFDPKGYLLIRANHKKKRIEVGFCNYNHVITKLIHGKNATEIYYAINRRKLLSNPNHMSYLGKELAKAEIALRYGLEYVQDDQIDFYKKIKKRK